MKDKVFKILLFLSALIMLLLMAGMLYSLIIESLPAFRHFGFVNFLTTAEWDPREGQEKYGALSLLTGTFLTAGLALLISIPFSISLAIFNGVYFRGTKIAFWSSNIVDICSGIPSIILGIWGYYTLRPIMIELNIGTHGFGILTASIVLSIMIIPYVASLCTGYISMVPQNLREAGYSLGATHIEVIRKISFPLIRKGVYAAYILALGRALGETMVITMLIGNITKIPTSITDTGNTLSSIIFNQIGAAGDLKLSSLFAVALLLFLITAIINYISRGLIRKFA